MWEVVLWWWRWRSRGDERVRSGATPAAYKYQAARRSSGRGGGVRLLILREHDIINELSKCPPGAAPARAESGERPPPPLGARLCCARRSCGATDCLPGADIASKFIFGDTTINCQGPAFARLGKAARGSATEIRWRYIE